MNYINVDSSIGRPEQPKPDKNTKHNEIKSNILASKKIGSFSAIEEQECNS